MKFIFAFLISACHFSASAQTNIDVLNYRFQVELNDRDDSIRGVAEIRVKYLQNGNGIMFDLTKVNKDGKGMKVGMVTGPDVRGISHNHDKLQIFFSKSFNAGDTVTITIPYVGIPTDGLIISKSKYDRRTFFSDNWPNRAHHWIPCVDELSDKASVEFHVIAPDHYQVVSNGLMIEESNLPDNKKLTVWKESNPIPTKVMVIGLADFAVTQAGFLDHCIPVTTWVYPENKKEGFSDYSVATDILSWLTNYIGPYPYQKLANVQSKTTFGGMENASAIFYSENSFTGGGGWEDLIAHEIAHQWFGNTVTEKSFAHLWLSEGFANYMEALYLESKYGTDTLVNKMQKARSEVLDFVKTSGRPVVDSTSDYMSLLNDNSYDKGSWILHMLRRQIGDILFQQSIRAYYAEFAWKNAESMDLQKIFERISGQNLSVFFNQWLHKPMNPSLKISWKWHTIEKVISVTVDQMQPDQFSFPLELKIGNRVEKINITKKSETFRIKVNARPAEIVVDPYTSLLFEAAIQEVK